MSTTHTPVSHRSGRPLAAAPRLPAALIDAFVKLSPRHAIRNLSLIHI